MSLPYQPRCSWVAAPASAAMVYQDLKTTEFRLLSLDGYTAQGVLRCSLRKMNIQQPDVYTAISYTWNETERVWYGNHDTSSKPIWIDGLLVHVTDKVANILCIASQHGKNLVWIDTICINQANNVEKSHQVAQMGRIYSGAAYVFCFLNSPTEKTDRILDRVLEVSDNEALKYASDDITDFHYLLKDSYWSRAWTLQEMVLNKAVFACCGSKIIPLSSLASFRSKSDATHVGLRGIPSALRTLAWAAPVFWEYVFHGAKDTAAAWRGRQLPPNADVLEVMRTCRPSSDCQDPRDLIYSRLALFPESPSVVPYPDYTLSVEELYKRFAANCILLTGSLEVITFATHTSRQLPSWVPDWTSRNSDWKLDATVAADVVKAIADTSWTNSDLPRISRCRREITVQGRILLTILKPDLVETLMSSLIRRTSHGEAYAVPELPIAGDLICILRGCPSIVYLRPNYGHYIVVARASTIQKEFEKVGIRPIANMAIQALQNVSDFPEVALAIR